MTIKWQRQLKRTVPGFATSSKVVLAWVLSCEVVLGVYAQVILAVRYGSVVQGCKLAYLSAAPIASISWPSQIGTDFTDSLRMVGLGSVCGLSGDCADARVRPSFLRPAFCWFSPAMQLPEAES